MILARQASTPDGTPGTLILKDWRAYRTIVKAVAAGDNELYIIWAADGSLDRLLAKD